MVDLKTISEGCRRASLKSRDFGDCARMFVSSRKIDATYETANLRHAQVSEGRLFAITNASLISMDLTTPELMRQATVLVEKGQIAAIGPGSDVKIPAHC